MDAADIFFDSLLGECACVCCGGSRRNSSIRVAMMISPRTIINPIELYEFTGIVVPKMVISVLISATSVVVIGPRIIPAVREDDNKVKKSSFRKFLS